MPTLNNRLVQTNMQSYTYNAPNARGAKERFTMDLPIPENVPQHKILSSHENTRKRRVMNNRTVQENTHSSANEASDTEHQANAEDYAKPKETLYYLLFECERFRAIREEYPILNKSVKKVYKALDNDDHQLMDYLNTVFSLLNIKTK